ncbi:MAG: cation:proton antiporter [Halothiobacillaceae bacterium]
MTIVQPFAELAQLLVITAVVGTVTLQLRQPMLIAFIAVGILVEPAGLEPVRAHDQIDLLAQVGIAVLLFLVGLKLDLQHVRHIGPVALATGLGPLTFTILFGESLPPCPACRTRRATHWHRSPATSARHLGSAPASTS